MRKKKRLRVFTRIKTGKNCNSLSVFTRITSRSSKNRRNINEKFCSGLKKFLWEKFKQNQTRMREILTSEILVGKYVVGKIIDGKFVISKFHLNDDFEITKPLVGKVILNKVSVGKLWDGKRIAGGIYRITTGYISTENQHSRQRLIKIKRQIFKILHPNYLNELFH